LNKIIQTIYISLYKNIIMQQDNDKIWFEHELYIYTPNTANPDLK